MKTVLYSRQALLQFEESIGELVAQNYFSDEVYAVQYIEDIVRYFSLNMGNLLTVPAPAYFNRYQLHGKPMQYGRYCKSNRTTRYAFFEELEKVYSIEYVGNNHLIGHHLDINL